MSGPLIQCRHVSKSFGPVQALADVSFDVRHGEFHALCGENGAGKSTLMKILSGVITEYEGSVEVSGQPVRFQQTRDADDAGIRIIHQELNLVDHLTVTGNIFLGRECRSAGLWLDNRKMDRQATELLSRLECCIPVDTLVRDLRVGDQQLVEIAKALSIDARVLIMDEPTSALTESEVMRLFRVISQLRQQGTTIVYISHKMEEIFGHADRITVLRDGRVIRTLARAETSPAEITRLMVGRDISPAASVSRPTKEVEVLRVSGLSLPWNGHARQWRLKDISFRVMQGEAVGIAGLMGAGRTELLECLYGSRPEIPTGDIVLNGRKVEFRHPADALRAGIAMVSEDRKREGVIAPMNVREHLTLSALSSVSTMGVIRSRQELSRSRDAIGRLKIRTAGTESPLISLSGGNQQKCLIAKAMETQPTLLLLDDPTRGIDVGAKAEIYQLIGELCARGVAVIMTSSELPELLTVCDRIFVLSEGHLTAEFDRCEFSEEKIMQAATQVVSHHSSETLKS